MGKKVDLKVFDRKYDLKKSTFEAELTIVQKNSEMVREVCDRVRMEVRTNGHLLNDLKNDLETVLALVSELDCVTTVGTAVSTIAAAAGTPTLLLVQRSWDLLGQQNSYPWFESVIPFVVDSNEHVGTNISKLPDFIKKRID